MAGGEAKFVGVTVSPAHGRFGFRVEIPSDWVQLAVPEEPISSDSPEFQPVAVFAARYGAMVLTLSVHPGFSENSVVEWFAGACRRTEIPVGDFVPARAGEIEGVQATGVQQSDAGPMAIRAFMFEQGGWAHILMAMAPQAVWDSLAPSFDHMFASFAMTDPAPSTVPVWPVGQLPPRAAAGGVDTAGAVAAAREFLEAVQRGDTAAAKAFLAPDDVDSINFPALPGDDAEFVLGEPEADGEDVIVPATLRARQPGQAQPDEQVLPLVLRAIEGAWKVDMTASISRMLGFDMGEALGQMAQGFGEALGEGLKEAFEGVPEIPHDPPRASEGYEPGQK